MFCSNSAVNVLPIVTWNEISIQSKSMDKLLISVGDEVSVPINACQIGDEKTEDRCSPKTDRDSLCFDVFCSQAEVTVYINLALYA